MVTFIGGLYMVPWQHLPLSLVQVVYKWSNGDPHHRHSYMWRIDGALAALGTVTPIGGITMLPWPPHAMITRIDGAMVTHATVTCIG